MDKFGSPAWSTADFERFVYADIATEPNGMELSVLSALSRRGLDPWQEAQRLALLPRLAAVESLTQVLRALPAVQSLHLDAIALAERLVTFLPVHRPAIARPLHSKPNATPIRIPRGIALMAIGAVLGGMLAPLVMPSQPESVAPASWLASNDKEPGNHQSATDKSTISGPSEHSEAPAKTVPSPSPTNH